MNRILFDADQLFLLALILVLILAGLLLLRGIFDNVFRVSRMFKRLASEEMPVSGTERDIDELHQITRSFNRLMKDLESSNAKLRQRVFELLSIRDLIDVAGKSLDVEALLELLLDKAVGVSGAKTASVLVSDPGRRRFRVAAVRGAKPGPEKAAAIETSPILRFVMEHRTPLLVQDIETDHRVQRPNDPKYDTPSFLSMPLLVKGDIFAVLNLSDKATEGVFDEHDRNILSIMINEVGFALENARLHADLAEELVRTRKKSEALTRLNEQLAREIDERMAAEAALRQSERQFYHAQKMESIGTLAGGVAHEFNNLLMAILGNANIMMLDLEPDDPHVERLARIETSVKRGALLIRQLLGFARGGKYEVRTLDVNDLIRRTVRIVEQTQKEIAVALFLHEDLWSVEGDPNQLDQMLMNLCANAWQAMPEGGELRIASENVYVTEAAGTVDPGPYIRITVTDTGIGMDETTRQRIFDPFFTTKAQEQAAGLGLAAVYGIVKNHGGHIEVDSEENEQTTFRVHLPASDHAPLPAASYDEDVPDRNITLLLVDDEEIILEVHCCPVNFTKTFITI